MSDEETKPPGIVVAVAAVALMPEQPKTVSLPAMTDRALLKDLARTVRNVSDNVGTMRQDVTTLMEDRRTRDHNACSSRH